MKVFNKKNFLKGILVPCLLSLLWFLGDSIRAQHIDVFNMPREKATKQLANAPELTEVEISDTYTYKVMVEKKKLEEGSVFAGELEIKELTSDEEKSPFHWGQVEYYDRRNIIQTHTRTTGFLKCFRTRTGILYLLPDGRRMVDWGPWSFWDCR